MINKTDLTSSEPFFARRLAGNQFHKAGVAAANALSPVVLLVLSLGYPR